MPDFPVIVSYVVKRAVSPFTGKATHPVFHGVPVSRHVTQDYIVHVILNSIS